MNGARDGFDIAPSVPVVLLDDVQAARDALKGYYALYIGGMGARGKNFYNELFARYGYEDEARTIQELYLDGKQRDATAAVPDEFVDAVALVGPKERIAERLDAFREAGATTLLVSTRDPARARAVAEADAVKEAPRGEARADRVGAPARRRRLEGGVGGRPRRRHAAARPSRYVGVIHRDTLTLEQEFRVLEAASPPASPRRAPSSTSATSTGTRRSRWSACAARRSAGASCATRRPRSPSSLPSSSRASTRSSRSTSCRAATRSRASTTSSTRSASRTPRSSTGSPGCASGSADARRADVLPRRLPDRQLRGRRGRPRLRARLGVRARRRPRRGRRVADRARVALRRRRPAARRRGRGRAVPRALQRAHRPRGHASRSSTSGRCSGTSSGRSAA